MLKSALMTFSALILFSIPPDAANAQNPAGDLLKDCSTELKSYCSAVTPGDGRLMYCVKAYQDKLSPDCASAVIRTGYWLEFLARTVVYVGTQCEADVKNFCAGVETGDDRIVNCLKANKAGLNKYCALALKDIGKD